MGKPYRPSSSRLCLGGLGLRETLGSSPAAFIRSCNLTCDLTSKLLPVLDSNLPFLQYTARIDSTCFRDLQLSKLSKLKESSMKMSHSEKDAAVYETEYAHLNAIATRHAGAWLRTVPNSHLANPCRIPTAISYCFAAASWHRCVPIPTVFYLVSLCRSFRLVWRSCSGMWLRTATYQTS